MKRKNLLFLFLIMTFIIGISNVSALELQTRSYNQENYLFRLFENLNILELTCGNGLLKNIPPLLPEIISTIVKWLKIGIPILVVIFGMIDIGKAVIAKNQEEINKNRSMFLKRLVIVVVLFLLVYFVELMINTLVASPYREQVID